MTMMEIERVAASSKELIEIAYRESSYGLGRRRKLHSAVLDYTCDSNQAFSLSSANARWDMRFFFVLSISAYVSPSYSKMGSQPDKGDTSQSDIPTHYSRQYTKVDWRLSGLVNGDLPKFVGPRAGTILP